LRSGAIDIALDGHLPHEMRPGGVNSTWSHWEITILAAECTLF